MGTGMIVWLTGQPGSGKTTLAKAMLDEGLVRYVVDGDDLRALIPAGYDEAGRRQNIDRAQAIAGFLSHKYPEQNIAVSLIAPYRDQREAFKEKFPVVEVYVHTEEKRGREHFFVEGYEPPQDNFLDIDTGRVDVAEALRAIHRAMAAAA